MDLQYRIRWRKTQISQGIFRCARIVDTEFMGKHTTLTENLRVAGSSRRFIRILPYYVYVPLRHTSIQELRNILWLQFFLTKLARSYLLRLSKILAYSLFMRSKELKTCLRHLFFILPFQNTKPRHDVVVDSEG